MATVSITNKTRAKLPRIPFQKMKDAALGGTYELSVAFLTPAEARKVTVKAKGVDKASNVLSFPLSKQSGEMLLCPNTARKQAPDYDMSYADFLAYLFIHGLVHLKGLDHGATMEREERRIAKRFGLSL